MKETMTPKERWIAALQMKPVDRIPVYAKLGPAYPEEQAAPFNKMDLKQMHEYVGSDRHVWIDPSYRYTFKNGAGLEKINDNGNIYIKYITKHGTLISHRRTDPETRTWHPIDMPVKTVEDIKIMTEWYENCELVYDKELHKKALGAYKAQGEDAIVSEVVVESPFMYFLEYLAGIGEAHVLLAEYPDEVKALYDAEDKYSMQRVKLAGEYSPADLLYIEENTSTTTMSPSQFREYCMPYLKKYTDMLHEAGKFVIYHMCGHLKLLLDDLRQLPNEAQEAFTPPAYGATTLIDGRTACPDKCFIGGCGASQWVTDDPEFIIDYIKNQFDNLPHHRGIVLTSAGMMPPAATPDTIKEVFDWVKNYKNIN